MRGRDQEWAVVAQYLRRAENGKGGVLLIEGEPGIGKSKLLSEAASAAAARGFSVSAASADELVQRIPLAPLLAAIGESPVMLPPEDIHLSPADQGPWPTGRVQARLQELAESGPTLVSLDDLQWADPVTLLVLRTLPERLGSYPVVWVLARCTDHEGEVQRLFELLEGDGAIRVKLLPLGDAAVAGLVEDTLGSAPDPGLRALAAGAMGNPFMLIELLHGLRDEAALHISGGCATLVSAHVPKRIQLLVRHKIALLSPRTRQLLEAAAVLGTSFSIEDAAEMLGETPAALLPAVDEAFGAGMLTATRDALVFRHELVWRAVADSMPHALTRALHRQFGEILLDRGGSAIVAAAYLLKGVRHGDRKALAGLDRAVRETLPHSPRTAADLAIRALELTDPLDPARADRSLTAIRALTAARRLDEASELVGVVLSRPLSSLARAELRCALSEVLRLTGQAEQAVAEAQGVLAQRSLPGELRDEAKIALLRGLAEVDDKREAERQVLAILTGEEENGIGVVVGALAVRAAIKWDEGQIAESLELSREAVAKADSEPLDSNDFCPRLDLAARLVDIRSFDEARAIVGEAEALAGLEAETGPGLLRARMDLAAGLLDDAVAEAEAALGAADARERSSSAWLAGSLLAIVALRRGDLLAAERYLGGARASGSLRSRAVRGRPGRGHENIRHCVVAAQVAEARQSPKAAVDLLGDVYDKIDERRWLLIGEPATAPWMVRAAHTAGDRVRAAQVAAVCDDIARANPEFRVVTAAAAHARGILDGDASALAHAAERHTDLWARASANEDLGILVGDSGDRRAAIARLDQALGDYERTGATRDVARVRRRLRRLGVRRRHWTTAERPAQGWASLTDTESFIAGLVSRGLTNRQIAGQMFVSPHTVAFHLRQIFRKLSISSRVELARLAIEQDRGQAGAARGAGPAHQNARHLTAVEVRS